MSTLYELTDSYLKLLEYAEDNDPTLFHDTLDSINDAIEDKAENYAKVDKELSKNQVALDEEIVRLKTRSEAIKKNRQRLKDSLMDSMKLTDKKTIKTNLFNISIRKNPVSVEITDEHKLPLYVMNTETKTITMPDKKKIKESIEEGIEIPGAVLKQNERLEFK